MDNGDYDDSLDEKSNKKNIPQEFYSKSSLVFSPDSDDSIELNVIDSSSSSTDEEEHSDSGNYELTKRFGLELLNATKHNTISPMKIILGEETRTTILIRNIPKNYLPRDLLNELLSNEDLKNKFNFFYLPINKKTNKNYGFSIINFTNPFHVILFFEMYQKKKFLKFITEKGLELNYIAYKNSQRSIANDSNEILIPLKYMKLFKQIYRQSVCIIKDVNFCNEGMFRVKTIGRNVQY